MISDLDLQSEIDVTDTNVTNNVEVVNVDQTEESKSEKGDSDEEKKPRIVKSLLDEDEPEEAVPVYDGNNDVISEDEAQNDSSKEEGKDILTSGEATSSSKESDPVPEPAPDMDLRDEEERIVGAEILFLRNAKRNNSGWDNLRWMAFSGVRKVRACEPVYRFVEGRKAFLWSKEEYVSRKVAVYDNPNLILILRQAENLNEFRELMELPSNAEVDERTALTTHLFVESVIDPKTAKLRLSPLTTVTSILPDVPKDDFRRRSAFELLTPFESIVLSAVRQRSGAERSLTSYTDSGAFLETSGVEYALTKSICNAHHPNTEDDETPFDLSWKHQIILGTLHSFVVIGNQKFLDIAITEALQSKDGKDDQNPNYLNSRIVDAIDESAKTPLHYACSSRFSSAVKSLVAAGADVNLRIDQDNMTPCHISAKHLDFNSLEAILAINRRPNVVDAYGRSPMYLAIAEGHTVGGQRNPAALDQCISVMEKYGGEVDAVMGHCHPVSYLASHWRPEELLVALRHCKCRYPLRLTKGEDEGISIGALFNYPVHSTVISLRKKVQGMAEEAQQGRMPNQNLVDMLKACTR